MLPRDDAGLRATRAVRIALSGGASASLTASSARERAEIRTAVSHTTARLLARRRRER
jgi:hypothetical protein